jgi:hypothetical protein
MKFLLTILVSSVLLTSSAFALSGKIGKSTLQCNNGEVAVVVNDTWVCRDHVCNRDSDFQTVPERSSGASVSYVEMTLACSSGELLTGGGCEPEVVVDGDDESIFTNPFGSYPSGNGWACLVADIPFGDPDRHITVHTVCCTLQ